MVKNCQNVQNGENGKSGQNGQNAGPTYRPERQKGGKDEVNRPEGAKLLVINNASL